MPNDDPLEKNTVDHIDGNKQNNNAENLRWLSLSDNVKAYYNKIKGEISIDEPLNKDCDGNELLLSDILGTDSDIISRDIEDEVDKTLLRASILKLNDREKNIMEMRFGFKTGKEKTQKEVADELRNFSKLYIKIRKKDYK